MQILFNLIELAMMESFAKNVTGHTLLFHQTFMYFSSNFGFRYFTPTKNAS